MASSSKDLGPLGTSPAGEFAREIERELGDIFPSTVLEATEEKSPPTVFEAKLQPVVSEAKSQPAVPEAKFLSPAEALTFRGVVERYNRYCVDGASEIKRHAVELGITDHQAATMLFSAMEQLRKDRAFRLPREVLIGLGSHLVEPACTVNLNFQAWQVLKIVRLEIPTDVAGCFLLNDLRLGRNSQFCSSGAVAMAAFATGSFRSVNLMLPDAWQISMFLTLQVTNKDVRAQNFSGVVVGWDWDDWRKWSVMLQQLQPQQRQAIALSEPNVKR